MSSVTWFVGLDYHQAFIQMCVMDSTGKMVANRRCDNSVAHLRESLRPLGGLVSVAIEACCGAADLAEQLIDAGWQVSLAHAGYVHKLKQSPDKSDWSDARLLADLLRVGYLPRVWLPPRPLRQLRHVVRLRRQLANERRAMKLRVTALLRNERVHLALSSWTKAWKQAVRHSTALGEQGQWVVCELLDEVDRLERKIRQVEERLESLTANDPFVLKLREQKGIGLVTAVTLRAELGTMERFRTGKQLARFCGLSPRNVSSGLKQADGGLIHEVNRDLRSVVIEAAHRLMRTEPRWSRLGASLKQRGKPGSVAAAAVGNRWMRWLYHELKNISV